MGPDKRNLERAQVLTRWRGTVPIRGGEPAPGAPHLSRQPLQAADPGVLCDELAAAVTAAVTAAMAEKLCGLLEKPRGRFLAEPSAKSRGELLLALDKLEDALDALLALPPAPGSEIRQAPP